MGKAFPQGPFKLGVLQPVINIGAIVYMIVSVVRPSPSTVAPCPRCSPALHSSRRLSGQHPGPQAVCGRRLVVRSKGRRVPQMLLHWHVYCCHSSSDRRSAFLKMLGALW